MIGLVPRLPSRIPMPTKGLTLLTTVSSIVPSLGVTGGDWDLDGSGTSPSSVTLNTQANGSSLFLFTFGEFATYNPPTYNGITAPFIHTSGYSGGLWPGFGLETYAFNTIFGGTGHVAQFTKTAATTESTLVAIEVKDGGFIQDAQVVARAAPGAGVAVTSASVTTTGPATLVAVWGGDGSTSLTDQTANPEAGYTTRQSLFLGSTAYIQAAVATKDVASAGTYSMQWTAVQNQGAILGLYAVQYAKIPQIVASALGKTTGSSGAYSSAAVNTTGATGLYIGLIQPSSSGPSSLTDSAGNTWTQDGTPTLFSSTFGGYLNLYRATGTINTSSTHTVTVDTTSSSSFVFVAVKPSRAGGTLTASTWVKTIDNTSPHTTTITPSQNAALILAVGTHDGTNSPVTYTWSNSFKTLQSELVSSSFWTISLAYKEVNSAGPHTVEYASNGSVVGAIVGCLSITES